MKRLTHIQTTQRIWKTKAAISIEYVLLNGLLAIPAALSLLLICRSLEWLTLKIIFTMHHQSINDYHQ
ncbi:MAG: hypothetical protein A3J38_00225 [Gammaproteobacteria bacterium RIFCSPHIGHO2_12_FULL_45_9]|nr:MAG: hypothetical protein A3J38_00225 [Gammaproteobacteria bacterium RIFCSPHIGHO2_12_FULL_45_9]